MIFNNPAFIPFIAREYINNIPCATQLEILKTITQLLTTFLTALLFRIKYKQLAFLISYCHS